MARWATGAAERLTDAALPLFLGQGFERTTAAEIAAAAGLTERTFFRYFADKRDVLFHGQQAFAGAFLDGIDAAPTGTPAIALVEHALLSAAAMFGDQRRSYSRSRQAVIDSNSALQERERHKLAGLAGTISAALRGRGIGEPSATLAGETCVTVFGVAFGQWISLGEQRSMADIAEATLAQLRALTS